jgi:hypothetical protein
MHKCLLAGLALVALVILPESAISYSLNYTLINNTDQPIVRIWASPTTSSKWVESTDVYVPRSGGRQRQNFDSSAYGSDCYYDIRIQFQGGDREVINHIDLCKTDFITIDVDRNGHVTYEAE